jgi:hypothetical protein
MKHHNFELIEEHEISVARAGAFDWSSGGKVEDTLNGVYALQLWKIARLTPLGYLQMLQASLIGKIPLPLEPIM